MTVVSPSSREGGGGGLGSSSRPTEVCQRYNEMRCTLQWCRYKHGLFDLRRASSSEQCQGDTRQFQGGQHEAEPSALA